MESVILVQIQDEIVWVSLCANDFRKRINPFFFYQIVEKNGWLDSFLLIAIDGWFGLLGFMAYQPL